MIKMLPGKATSTLDKNASVQLPVLHSLLDWIHGKIILLCYLVLDWVTMFMLIEHMIQLPQENSNPGIVCILLERKPLHVIIFHESN